MRCELHRGGVAAGRYLRRREYRGDVRKPEWQVDATEPILPQPHPAGNARREHHYRMYPPAVRKGKLTAGRHQPSSPSRNSKTSTSAPPSTSPTLTTSGPT